MNSAAHEVANECELLYRLRDSQALLEEVSASQEGEFALQKRLRKTWPAELVRAAMQLIQLRSRARAKFTRADEMWFDSVGLEQSTSELIARHKATRFSGGGDSTAAPIYDLCCGIGGDTIALCEVADVVAVDANAAQCLRTEWNAAVYHPPHSLQTRCGDVESIDIPHDARVHIDPDRRASGRRSLKLEAYVPGLPFLQQLIARQPGGAIKLSPASNFGGKFEGCEIELISWQGECREATVWFGDLNGDHPMRATRLPEGVSLAGNPWDDVGEVSDVRKFVFDPDPAVVRAGLVDKLATELGVSRLDEAEEYLTGDNTSDSPLVSAFEVLDVVPNNDRKVRDAVRNRHWHEIEIKCRHLKVDADEIRRKLPLDGTGRGSLIYARVGGKAKVIVARRV